MADIDSLLIDITANSSSATASLQGLASELTSLQGALNTINVSTLSQLASGINEIGLATKNISGIDKRSFSSLVTKFNALSNINSANLTTTAQTIGEVANAFGSLGTIAQNNTTQIRDLVSAVGTLGGAKIQKATLEMPLLANAITDLMRKLSTAPTVSKNVIDVANALANLSSQGSRIGSASSQIQTSMRRMANSTSQAKVSFKGLTSQIGLFYAKFFLVMRGIKKVWQSTESAMDYVETFNYWNVALGKVQDDFKGTFSNFGYESAETYAESFSTRLKELTRKMTGYRVGDNGELISTNSIGLGMDADAIMNYQAKILGVTNSVGLLGETSINTAKALSMLSGDLSSLTNTDLSDVMADLQSGLIGQSRALYKYGIDITNTTLAQVALEHNVTKAVANMSQQEKMQLRVLAILKQSRVSWGDQANTINSVANQYRVLTQQLSNTGRTLGSILLPVVQKILPYLNAILIVIQRILSFLGAKIWGDNWLAGLQDGISSGASAIEDMGEEMDDANNSAKALKKQLQGFDELNVLSTNDKSGSGVGGVGGAEIDLWKDIADATSEYEKVWNEALKKSRNKAEEIANALSDSFEKFKNTDFYKSLETLLGILKNLVKISFKNITTFYEKFLKPVAKWAGNTVFKKLVDLCKDFANKIDWNTITEAFSKFWEVLAKFTMGIGNGLINFFTLVLKLVTPALALIINSVADALTLVFKALNMIPTPILEAIGSALGGILTFFLAEKLVSKIRNFVSAFEFFIDGVRLAKEGLIAFMVANPAILWGTVIAGAIGVVIYAISQLNEAIEGIKWDVLRDALSGDTTLSDFATMVTDNFSTISASFDGLNEKAQEISATKEEIANLAKEIQTVFTAFDNGANLDGQIDSILSSFERFLTESKRIFTEEYLYIVMGTTGAIDEADKQALAEMERQIAELSAGYNQVIDSFDVDISTFNSIAEQLANNEIDVTTAMKELESLGASFKEFSTIDTTAIENNLKELKGSLDFTEIISDDNKLDIEALQGTLNQISTAYSEGVADIRTQSEEAKGIIEDLFNTMESRGATVPQETKDYFSNMFDQKEIDAINEYKNQIIGFVDEMEIQVVERFPKIISDSEDTFDSLSWFKKKLVGDSPAKLASDTALEFEGKVIVPFQDEVNTFLQKTIGVEGNNQMLEAVNAMFDITFEGNVLSDKLKFADDYSEALQTKIADLRPSWESCGQQIVEHIGGGGKFGAEDVNNYAWLSTYIDNLERNVVTERGRIENIGKQIGGFIGDGVKDTLNNTTLDVSSSANGNLKISQYATGGFPEDGIFLANHNEMVGKFSNGKTAVANNEQITKGIANAVYEAIVSAGGLGNNNVSVTLEGDSAGLFKVVQRGATDFTRRTGRPAFS